MPIRDRFRELERKNIEDEILANINRPLLIISAPSGYGKTMIARAFFSRHPEIKSIWISLGRMAVDENFVWKKLCDSLKENSPRTSEMLRELGLPRTRQELEAFFTIIKRGVIKPVCLVLDDYHECNGQASNRLIERVVYEEIPNLHIMILSRTFPDISYEEMFLKGYCTILDQKSLALSREESERIFSIHGISLTEPEKNKMYEYTNGWIAAVYLVLYDYMRINRLENFTSIGRLLKNSIFDKLSDGMKELCMKMSLFESFTLEEAHFVLRRKTLASEIAQMQEIFGFIQFDITSRTYIMHELLKSVARRELENQKIDRNEIYIRFAQCREKAGNYISALASYANANAYDRVLQLLTKEQRYSIYEQAPGIVGEILESVPIELRMKYPAAYLGYLYFLLLRDDVSKGEELFLEIKERYEQAGEWEPEEYNRIKGELLVVGALLDFNRLEIINSKLQKACELLDGQPSAVLENMLLTYGTPTMTVLYYNEPGSLFRVKELEKTYAGYYMRLIKKTDRGWNDFFDAEYYLLRGDFARAEMLANKVLMRTIQKDGLCVDISAHYIKLRCLIGQGKTIEVEDGIRTLTWMMRNVTQPILVTEYELVCGYVYACIGENEKVPVWLRQFKLDNCNRMVRNVRSGCVIYGTMLCRQHKWEKLDAVAEQMLVPYDTTWHNYITVFGHLCKAIAVLNLEGIKQACGHFLKAVELAERDQLTIPFIERGGDILPIVEALSKSNRFCRELLTPVKEYQKGLRCFERKPPKVILTAREKEIMALVNDGFRNQEISEKMNIAPVTVEKTLTNVYRKLNVSNRTSAVSRMKELNME